MPKDQRVLLKDITGAQIQKHLKLHIEKVPDSMPVFRTQSPNVSR